jgi:L-ascorbate metabolism protein UlaG (beta-lactamase superfamily)
LRIRRRLALLFALAAGPAAADDAVTVRWLGVAGFSVSAGDSVLLHDPYLSRPSLWRTATSWYRPDPAVLEPLLRADGPTPELARADAILIGHSHFDHLGDAPWLAQRSGAQLVGSRTSALIAQAYGLPAERALQADPGTTLQEGPFRVRVIGSRHAKVLFGRVPLEGTFDAVPEAPLHALSFPLGDARLYLVRHEPSGVQVLLASSASVDEAALAALASDELRVDLALLASQGWDAGYVEGMVRTFRPRRIVPHHYESFFEPLSSPDAATPGDPADLEAFEQALREASRTLGIDTEVRRMTLFEEIRLEGGQPLAEQPDARASGARGGVTP